MGKIISFELKKLVSRIGIYVLALLLAGLLVFSAYKYNPEQPTFSPIGLAGDTVTEMYQNFELAKVDSEKTISNVVISAEGYIVDSGNYNKYNNKNTLMDKLILFDDLCLLYSEASTATNPDYPTLLTSIRQTLNDLTTEVFNNALAYEKGDDSYYVLTTNKNYSQLKSLLDSVPVYATSFDGEAYINHFRNPIFDCFKALVYPDLNLTAQKYIDGGAYYNLVTGRLEEIEYKIEQEYNKVVSDPLLNDDVIIKRNMNDLFVKYYNSVNVFENAFNTSITVGALNSVSSKSDRADLYQYSDIDLYKYEELQTKYIYYLENNVSESNFANGLSVTHTSNQKTNAYDFTFFVMSLFTVAIILFAIYLASHTISGEINNKSMRFTAIRPVSRGSLFFGKYFAIIIMSTILLLFSTITSLCVGGIIYGFDSLKILMVINGNSVFVAHPLLMIGLFTLSNFLIIVLYTAITMLFSSILRSELLAMLISVIIYAGNLVLPLFFGATSWLRFYPLANVNLFAYFGSTQQVSESVLSKLFNSVVYQGMNIWITLVYIIGITAVLLAIGKVIFKKRQL